MVSRRCRSMVKNENESGRRFVGRWLRIVICVSLVFIFQFPFLNSISAQNYSSNDTVTEYPNKGTYYNDKFEGRKTASGEIFDQNAFTAAHWRIKLGTYILVTNQNTGLQVIVKVNDRCPKHGVIDLSHRAATAIGIRGCQPVCRKAMRNYARHRTRYLTLSVVVCTGPLVLNQKQGRTMPPNRSQRPELDRSFQRSNLQSQVMLTI